MLYIKILFASFLLYNSFSLYANPFQYSFIQTVNLIFHEAGHVLLIWAGDFLHILGGTLFEITIPLFVAIYFWFKKQYFSTFFSFWWLSTALNSVSIYAADARSRSLPLLGGDSVGHDWFNILTKLGLLSHDKLIANWLMFFSFFPLAVAIFFLFKDLNNPIRKLLAGK